MFTRKISTALFLCLLATGCGKQNSDTSSSLVHEIPVSDLQSAQNLAKSSSVSCADSASCNPSIGMLVATRPATLLKPAAVLTCTAFLVGPDLIMTNSHCVPADLKSPLHFSSCSERLKVIFPGSDSLDGVEVKCDYVPSFSQSKVHALADYALIKLQSATGRPSLKLDANGISDGQNFDIFKVNPASQSGQDEPKGILTKGSCFATQGSYVLPSYSSPFSVVASLAGCDAVPGNSGSPLINQSGAVSGIFQDIVTPNSDPNFQAALSSYLSDPNLANQIYATNLACVSLPLLSYQPNPQCAFKGNADASISLKGIEAEDPQELAKEKATESNFTSWEAQNGKVIHWQIHPLKETTLSRRSILVPECFYKTDAWISDYPANWYDFFQSHSSQASIELPNGIPEFNTQFLFNRYLQPQTVTSSGFSKSEISVQFNPNEMATKGSGKVTVLENKQVLVSVDIQECANSVTL